MAAREVLVTFRPKLFEEQHDNTIAKNGDRLVSLQSCSM